MKLYFAGAALLLAGCASSPEDRERGVNTFVAALAAMNDAYQQGYQSQPQYQPAYRPQYQATQPATPAQETGIASGSPLKFQRLINNNMRYCHYYNGALITVSVAHICPVATP